MVKFVSAVGKFAFNVWALSDPSLVITGQSSHRCAKRLAVGKHAAFGRNYRLLSSSSRSCGSSFTEPKVSTLNHRFWLQSFSANDEIGRVEGTLADNYDNNKERIQALLKLVTDMFQLQQLPSSNANSGTTYGNEGMVHSGSPSNTQNDTPLYQQLTLPRSEMGMILIPKYGFIVPLHDGIVQNQHAVLSHDLLSNTLAAIGGNHPSTIEYPRDQEKMKILVCGFSPRAAHTTTAPSEEERPINPERQRALNEALSRMTSGIKVEDLCGERFGGTPPARIYRSFVAPRRNANILIEPVERAAIRAAQQIELAVRQVLADEATRLSFMRNTDKSLNFTHTTSETGDSAKVQRDIPHPLVLVMDNIRSANNVGSMFRTAETARLSEVITCGITAHPPNPKLQKTALSAVDIVPSRHFQDVLQAIDILKADGYTIVVMETTKDAKCYTEMTYPAKTAIVVGNEITGVDQRVIAKADCIIEIPMYGIKNSLNVASAAPVVVFEILRQWKRDNLI